MTESGYLAHLVERREAHVELLRHLVGAAAGGHAAVQAFVAERLQAAGADVSRVSYDPRSVKVDFEVGIPSDLDGDAEYVVGSFGTGDDGLLLWAHSDSERVDAVGWTRPLFEGEIDRGRLHGWGVGDDLVGVALMLALAETQARTRFLGPRRTLLASVPSKRRAQAIIHALDSGFVGGASVYLHPAESGSGLNEIKAIASGLLRFRVRIHGRRPPTNEPGHTVFLHLGVDPVRWTAMLILALEEFGRDRAARVRFPAIDALVGRATNIHVSHLEGGRSDRLGQIPQHVDVYGSVTFPPTEAVAAVQAEVTAVVRRFALRDEWLEQNPPELTWLVGISGSATPLDGPIYRLAHDAIRAATGREAHVNPLHAGSDIRNPTLHAGIPTVGLGPLVGDLTVAGGCDEWVDVDDYLRSIEVVCRIADGWSRG